MTDTNLTHDQEMRVESHAPYIKVFLALAVFTAIEYFYARIFKDSFTTLVLGLMFWAVIKASLVGWFFMHLKFEGKWVYYMLVPAGILAIILTVALVPDLAMQPVTEENPEEEESTPVSLLETGGVPSIFRT
jgi:cytochrome c oxidase subunit IV